MAQISTNSHRDNIFSRSIQPSLYLHGPCANVPTIAFIFIRSFYPLVYLHVPMATDTTNQLFSGFACHAALGLHQINPFMYTLLFKNIFLQLKYPFILVRNTYKKHCANFDWR